jgi:hypothetical protein
MTTVNDGRDDQEVTNNESRSADRLGSLIDNSQPCAAGIPRGTEPVRQPGPGGPAPQTDRRGRRYHSARRPAAGRCEAWRWSWWPIPPAGPPDHGGDRADLRCRRRVRNHPPTWMGSGDLLAAKIIAHTAGVGRFRSAAALASYCARPKGQAYYQRKRAEGKSHKEPLRCLKRRLCDVVYRAMIRNTDASLLAAA